MLTEQSKQVCETDARYNGHYTIANGRFGRLARVTCVWCLLHLLLLFSVQVFFSFIWLQVSFRVVIWRGNSFRVVVCNSACFDSAWADIRTRPIRSHPNTVPNKGIPRKAGSFIHSFIRSFNQPRIHSVSRSFIHSFINSNGHLLEVQFGGFLELAVGSSVKSFNKSSWRKLAHAPPNSNVKFANS